MDVELAFETTWQNKWIDYIWRRTHTSIDKSKIRVFNIYSTEYNTTFVDFLRKFSSLCNLTPNRSSFDVNIDFIQTITSSWYGCPSWWINSDDNFTLIIGNIFARILHKRDSRHNFKQIYVTHYVKWLNLLTIYDDYWENSYKHENITNGERILYDDYLLHFLIQY
jgi:hypothetical protein